METELPNMYKIMNSNTSNSDNPSEDSTIYAYYSIGLSLCFLLLVMFIALTSYFCTRRNLQNTQSTRATAGSISRSSSSHRTVIMDGDISAITIQLPCEEEVEAILNSYPLLLYSQAKLHRPDHHSPTLSCSICLADYKDSEWLRLLPYCGHFFHKDCIDIWLRLNLSCPMCRNSPFQTPLAHQVAPFATSRDSML